MELLEFKNQLLNLCKITEVKDISKKLFNVVLSNDIDFYDRYNEIIDDTKDWLQALWQYYEADRTEKKQDYTPKSLCNLVSALAGYCNNFYDCCGGSGALSIAMLNNNKQTQNIFVEELDKNVIPFLLFNLCLHNATGLVTNGNVLTEEKKKVYKLQGGTKYSTVIEVQDPNTVSELKNISLDVAISNPPYNIKWNPPTPVEMDSRFPVIPPANNANYAFVLHCLSKANKVVMILPNGVMTQENEIDIRKYLVDNDLIETIVALPERMFEVTGIPVCIIVLNKNKKYKGRVTFVDSRKNCTVQTREQNGQFGGASHTNRTYKKQYNVFEQEHIQKIMQTIDRSDGVVGFSAKTNNEEIAKNNYTLQPSRYIELENKEGQHRDFQQIADNINYINRMRNSCKLVINETVAKQLGFDIEQYKQSKESSKLINEQMKSVGIKIDIEDYIQFTKAKNEFCFKCNDKENLPEVLLQFLSIWKNQIALLNTMQNKYLIELRDALLPDLMSGKINVDGLL